MPIKLPIGVSDYIGQEYCNKAIIESVVANVFEQWGYNKVEPSALDYAEVYSRVMGMRNSFKIVDYDGNLLLLRPDATLQLSRIVASKLRDKKISRLSYNLNSYEFDSKPHSGRDREFCQAGAELFGDASINADIEIISMSIEMCLQLGIKDFLIELGQIDFFYGIVKSLGLDNAIQEQLRELVSTKDMISAEMLLKDNGISSEDIMAFKELPYLFGGREVFEKARSLITNSISRFALESLESIYNTLEAVGLGNYITIDLSMVKSKNYYTGMVFRGINQGLGQSFMDGGRYDGLCKTFGANIPAVGFAAGIKRLMLIMEKQGLFKGKQGANYAYITETGLNKYVYKFVRSLRKSGERVLQCPDSDLVQAKEFCRANNIPKLIVFSDNQYLIHEIKD